MKSVPLLLAAAVLWGVDSVAIVKNVEGDARIKHAEVYRPAEKGSYMEAGDMLITSADASAGLAFRDGTVVAVGPKSVFLINRYRFEPSQSSYDFDMSLKRGTVAVETGKIGKLAPKNVSFHLPQGSIGIRGTKFLVEVEE